MEKLGLDFKITFTLYFYKLFRLINLKYQNKFSIKIIKNFSKKVTKHSIRKNQPPEPLFYFQLVGHFFTQKNLNFSGNYTFFLKKIFQLYQIMRNVKKNVYNSIKFKKEFISSFFYFD